MLFPITCPLCGRGGAAPCGPCIEQLVPAGRRPPPPGVDGLWCLVEYDRAGSELVGALKFRNARRLVPWLALALADLVPADVQEITWAPTTTARRRRRGYDQAALLARATGRRCGVPVRRLVARLDGPSQTGRSRDERLTGPRFEARTPVNRDVVAVIDDVVTTGATLAASAEVLRGAGALRVVGLTVAHTSVGRARAGFDPPPSLAHSGGQDR